MPIKLNLQFIYIKKKKKKPDNLLIQPFSKDLYLHMALSKFFKVRQTLQGMFSNYILKNLMGGK